MDISWNADVEYWCVSFDHVERSILERHAQRNGLDEQQAVEDMLERVFSQVTLEIEGDERDGCSTDADAPPMVDAHLVWPKTGPFSTFTDDDKCMVASQIALAIREACTIVLWRHMSKGVADEFQKEDG